jgi:hypothetical protein
MKAHPQLSDVKRPGLISHYLFLGEATYYIPEKKSVLVSGLRQNTVSLNQSQQTTLRPRAVPPKLTTHQSVGNPNIASQLLMLMADLLCNEQKIKSNANRLPLRKNISQKFQNIV